MIEVLYFAWLRERVGERSERIETDAATVMELVEDLRTRSDAHALALSDMNSVRVAIDQDMADLDASLAGAREVAFFPPMTGG
ncbi:MAG: molybdopterin converting factor subunit 1 [Boseongicola sp. SB0664_bin_43]|uniref:Molybdopterin synthase sulfur carrier subunit n=1 Tax=Boseongicola sp. SB0664_bin_43 TaxID=2604844 RepID=A0A6B0XYD6_9RHOB|nr:molybdopterin converting factor subunit 1 [Boseongicola sp. SB0664_bin_43]MYK31026.1 molybdopterin converting factor subunit 1 [Boseongicola sp. SB0670_bin_30]